MKYTDVIIHKIMQLVVSYEILLEKVHTSKKVVWYVNQAGHRRDIQTLFGFAPCLPMLEEKETPMKQTSIWNCMRFFIKVEFALGYL